MLTFANQNKRYWDTTISGAAIVPSRTSILETLQKITQDPPKIAPKYTTNKIGQAFMQAKGASRSHPWLASIFVVVTLILAAVYGRGRMARRRRGNSGGFFHLDGKEGLLGGNSGEKAD